MNKDSAHIQMTSKSPRAILRASDLPYLTNFSNNTPDVSDKPVFHPEGNPSHGVGFTVTPSLLLLQNFTPVPPNTSLSTALQNSAKPKYQRAANRKLPKLIELVEARIEKPM